MYVLCIVYCVSINNVILLLHDIDTMAKFNEAFCIFHICSNRFIFLNQWMLVYRSLSFCFMLVYYLIDLHIDIFSFMRRRRPTKKNRFVNYVKRKQRYVIFFYVAALLFDFYLFLLFPVVDLFFFLVLPWFGRQSTLLSPCKFIADALGLMPCAIWIWPKLFIFCILYILWMTNNVL